MSLPPPNGGQIDRIRYMIAHAGLRHRLLQDPIPKKVVWEVASKDDGKYFVVFHKRRRLQQLRTLRLNGLLAGVEKVIPQGSRFTRDDIEAFINGYPMGIYEIIRLHECFVAEVLNDTSANETLRDFGLREGIRLRDVVPMIYAFDPVTFNPILKSVGGPKGLVETMAEATGHDEQLIATGLENLRRGYDRKKTKDEKSLKSGKSNKAKSGTYRISRTHALTLHNGLCKLAKPSKTIVPEFSALFSCDPARYRFGTKLGTKPLPRTEGAIY